MRAKVGQGYELGFSVKSSHPEGLSILASQVDGFDASNLNEYRLIEGLCTKEQQIWLTNCSETDVEQVRARHPNVVGTFRGPRKYEQHTK